MKKQEKNKLKVKKEVILVNADVKVDKDSIQAADAVNWARNLQQMSPNKLNSVLLANIVKKEFAEKHKNISVKVLTKPEIKKLGMNLLLAVNAGSQYDARVVALEYKGNSKSKEKTVMVGKGIIFDSGGYDIKTGNEQIGMKYDMSGSVIVAGAMKVISHQKPKANVSALMVITDNKLSLNATTPDSVIKSMNGKTIEISAEQEEHLWRMPFHEDYGIGIKSSDVAGTADIKGKPTGIMVKTLGNLHK